MTNLCPYCFADRAFHRRLKELRPSYPRDEKCDFHPSRSGIPVEAIAPILDGVIAPNYVIGEFHPIYDRDDDRPDWKQEGDSLVDIIYDLTGAQDDGIVRALVDQLIDDDPADPRDGSYPFYADDQTYVRYENPYNPRSEAWQQFKVEIVHNRRFFSELARDRLSQIFQSIHNQKDNLGNPVVYQLDPKESLKIYRARQINNAAERQEALRDPANRLGSPPKRFRSAGRMNAAGVPAFYGAFDIDTCIAEVRPSVGSMIVAAAFRPIRPLIVLDTTRFERPIQARSIFSPVYADRLQQWSFMQSFMHEISRPVLPDDILLDYIPTQVVAEFINTILTVKMEGQESRVEAIIFASAQNPRGRNIVLFGDAALVVGSEPSDEATAPERLVGGSESWTSWTFDQPNAGLMIVADSVVSHEVTGVLFRHELRHEIGPDDFEEAADLVDLQDVDEL